MTAPNPLPRVLHTMLRVTDLNRSLSFYVEKLGMRLIRREEYPEGGFTLAFVGYGDERSTAVIELTHNWESRDYEHGTAFGHVALQVGDLQRTCHDLERLGVEVVRRPGPMIFTSPDRTISEQIAFVADPDGYRIELIERPD